MGLMPDEVLRLTMREFFWKLRARIDSGYHEWDLVRHLMAVWVGKSPQRIMPLPGDRKEITDDEREEAKKLLEKMKQKQDGN